MLSRLQSICGLDGCRGSTHSAHVLHQTPAIFGSHRKSNRIDNLSDHDLFQPADGVRSRVELTAIVLAIRGEHANRTYQHW